MPVDLNKKYIKAFVLAALCLSAAGCATTKSHQYGYKVEGREYRKFADLSDEDATKVVVSFFNVPDEIYEDSVAKYLTIQKYMEILEKRKSEYIENSGIFGLAYKEIDLKLWNDQDLVTVYEALERRTIEYRYAPVATLTERENALRICRLTGMNCLIDELRRRKNTREAWGVAAQLVTVALQVALSMI